MSGDSKKLEHLREHLPYELMMLRYTLREILDKKIQSVRDRLEWNTRFESFAVHARGLYKFLISSGFKDDILAKHFAKHFAAPKDQEMENILDKLNPQVFHIGQARSINLSEKASVDDCTRASCWIEAQFKKFVDELDQKYRSKWRWDSANISELDRWMSPTSQATTASAHPTIITTKSNLEYPCRDRAQLQRQPKHDLLPAMQGIEIRSFNLDDRLLRTMDPRKRNQLLGCMHAHNELTFLNRLLLFSSNPVSEGELHDQAQSSQSWCLFQLLAGKLYETWHMLAKRFCLGNKAKQDVVVAALDAEHQASLTWLRGYFSGKDTKDKAIAQVRNRTAFHYEGLDMGQAVKNLAAKENTFHIAQHPANTLYWVGSAVVFRTIFAEIAAKAKPDQGRSHSERVEDGFHILRDDIDLANLHMHLVLYGLIKGLIEDAIGQPLGGGEVTNIEGAPTPERVALCPWLDMKRVAAVRYPAIETP